MAIAPIKTSFLTMSMIGFLVSVLYIPQIAGTTWAFTFGMVFIIMFIASIISMIRGTPDEQLFPRPKKIE